MAARKLKAESESPSVPQNNRPGGNTVWKNGVPSTGWYRMPDEWWRDLPRLQRGLYQRMLIEYVWASMVPRVSDGSMPEWSIFFAWSDLAEMFRCSVDQVRDDARDAGKRGMIALEESRGRVKFRILLERWPNLKSYTAPAPRLIEKKERVSPSSRWLAGVSVKAGASYDFTVPELPADFRLQKISLRNTGESGEVVFAGGGPAEGGILILETHSGEVDSIKSEVSEEKRESTPRSDVAGRVAETDGDHLESGNRGARNPVSGSRNRKDGPGATRVADGLPSDATLRECLGILAKHGSVVTTAFLSWFRKLSITSDKALEAIRAISIANPEKSVQWVLGMVPRMMDGTYKPGGEKKQSAREQLADEIWGSGRRKRA